MLWREFLSPTVWLPTWSYHQLQVSRYFVAKTMLYLYLLEFLLHIWYYYGLYVVDGYFACWFMLSCFVFTLKVGEDWDYDSTASMIDAGLLNWTFPGNWTRLNPLPLSFSHSRLTKGLIKIWSALFSVSILLYKWGSKSTPLLEETTKSFKKRNLTLEILLFAAYKSGYFHEK